MTETEFLEVISSLYQHLHYHIYS